MTAPDKCGKFPNFTWPEWMDLATRAKCLVALEKFSSVGAIELDEGGWGGCWDTQTKDPLWLEANPYAETDLSCFSDCNYDGLLNWDECMHDEEIDFIRDGVGIGTKIVFAISIEWSGSYYYPLESDPEFYFEIIKIIQPPDLEKQTLEICERWGTLLKG